MNTLANDFELAPDEFPEHVDHTVEKTIIPTYHQWRQFGNWLRCVSCERAHAVEIGINKRLVEIKKDGTVVFADC